MNPVMKLFKDKPIYLYGKIHKNKFITPGKTYNLETDFSKYKSTYLPALYTGKLEIFFTGRIFNSYLVSTEENIRMLFSVDGKTTITKDKMESNVIHTFIIEEENETVRKVKLYKFDLLYPGLVTSGKLAIVNKYLSIKTPYGTGRLILQNNTNKDKKSDVTYNSENPLENFNLKSKMEVLLFKKDRELHFVQIDNPVKTRVNLKVLEVKSNYYLVGCGNIKGIFFSDKSFDVNDSVLCLPKETMLGFYIFEEAADVNINDVITGTIVGRNKKTIFIEYKGNKGFINTKKNLKGQVRGKIIRLEEGTFEIELINRENIYKNNLKTEDVNLAVPFTEDSTDVESSLSSSDIEPVNLNERKRSEIKNEEDFLMEVRSSPGKALPIIEYIQFLIENNREASVKNVFDKYVVELMNREKDMLCISYINYLIYIDDKDLFKHVKALMKVCGDYFIEVVASNTNNVDIIKLYHNHFNNKKSYAKYLEVLLQTRNKDAYDLINDNPKYLSISINLIYKYKDLLRQGDSCRSIIEKLIAKDKESWISYLNNEKGDYKRNLFRRVVDLKWKVNDMKEFYRMWLQWESDNDGNVDEVRTRAKEYVESIKSKK